jgi:hypothetical protein
MGLFQWLKETVQGETQEPWPSVVFLLNQAHLPSAREGLELARSAWGAAGPVELIRAVREHSFLLQASELMFALHAEGARYEIAEQSMTAVQLQCWDQHSAWLSVDLPGRATAELRAAGTLGSAYRSLMFFAFKYWSPNCLGIYFPDERITVPNQGDLIQSIRWLRANGVDLTFLKI